MDGRKAAGADGYPGKDGKVKVYKGFYEAVVRIDFSIDEKMPDLLSFNEIKAGVEDGELTNQVTDLLEKELKPIATVSVKQTGAALMDIPERQGKQA